MVSDVMTSMDRVGVCRRLSSSRAASPVNPLGRVAGDAKAFLGVPDGAEVRIERAE